MSGRKELPVRAVRCGACRFWELLDPQAPDNRGGCHPDDLEGHCRRRPPQFLSSVLSLVVNDDRELHDEDGSKEYRFDALNEAFRGAAVSSYWGQPVTTAADWCGEWRAKEPPEGNP